MGLADFLISKRQQAIMAALFLHPERSYSVRDLIRIGGMGHGAIQNMLGEMYEAGVILDHREGNQRRYRANPDFPLYSELRSICVKSFGVQERLRTALAPMGDQVEVAFVFGSIAKGTDRPDSDVDIFIVGSSELFELNAALADVEGELGRTLHTTLYSREEFAEAMSDPVVRGIVEGPKIMVIGSMIDLENIPQLRRAGHAP